MKKSVATSLNDFKSTVGPISFAGLFIAFSK